LSGLLDQRSDQERHVSLLGCNNNDPAAAAGFLTQDCRQFILLYRRDIMHDRYHGRVSEAVRDRLEERIRRLVNRDEVG
ncbi:hypothetical protein ACCS72_38675, partial [Rhizobium ruizarguesonis]